MRLAERNGLRSLALGLCIGHRSFDVSHLSFGKTSGIGGARIQDTLRQMTNEKCQMTDDQ